MPVLRAVEDGNRTMRAADDVAGYGKWLMSTGAAMPSYNIRHSIATKVTAKKTGKGYTLSAEYCDLCEMPMMTLKGKIDCKVCPAIKKWMQRRDGGIVNNEQGVDEARDVIDTAEEADAEIRDSEESWDEMPVDPPVCDSQVDLVVEETPLENPVIETPLANLVDITAVESTDSNDSDNSTAIRERARQIIMNAKNRLGVALAAIGDDDQDELAKDEVSVESKSDQSEVVLSESMEEQKVRDRAAKIIMQARKKLHAERGHCAEEVKPKEPIVINIEQKKSVEVKPAMTSELMDVITVPIDEVSPPKEVVLVIEEIVPEVKKEMIETSEAQKLAMMKKKNPSDRYEVVEVITVTSSKSDVTLETLKAALKEEIKVIESNPMKIEEVNEVQKEEFTDNCQEQIKIKVGEVQDYGSVVHNAGHVIAEGVVQAVDNLVDKSPDYGMSLVDDIVTEKSEEKPAAADDAIHEQLENKPEKEQTADYAAIPSSQSIGAQAQCMTVTTHGGIFSGIASNIINAANDVATTFKSLVICNIDGPYDNDCVYDVPPQYEARTKYNPHEAATYEVADTYHLNLLSQVKTEYQAVVLEEHLIDAIIASARPPVAPQSLAPTVLYAHPAIDDSGVLSVGTMLSPQNVIQVKETINAYNPSNVYSKPPLPRPSAPVESQESHMLTLPSVSADSWGDSHPPKQFELSKKLRVDEEIALWKQQELSKQLQVNNEIKLSNKIVNDPKLFLVGGKATIDAPVDVNSVKVVEYAQTLAEDTKENMASEANNLPPMDDAMRRVEDPKMFLNRPGKLTQMDGAMRRVEEAKMFVNSRRTPTAQYHGELPFPMRVPLKMNPIGDNHPGCFSRQTSTAEVSKPQMAPSPPPQVFRGMGSLIDNAPQATASVEPTGSGNKTPQMPGKYFFA